MTAIKSIVWFRQDLRLEDNPALVSAMEKGDILPIYILDDVNAGQYKQGAASRVWLHHALKALDESLAGKLNLYKGDPLQIIPHLCDTHGIENVFWNRCYEPWRIARDKKLKPQLEEKDVNVESSNGSLLWEPWTILKQDETPYRVFTPFYRKGCLNAPAPRKPYSIPKSFNAHKDKNSCALQDLNLIPEKDWHKDMTKMWDISEKGGQQRLQDFLDEGLNNYKEGRNFPAQKNVSRLSPYLHFGQISPNTVWYKADALKYDDVGGKNKAHFLSELGWREFSYYLLFHFPTLPEKNFQPKFDHFPWVEDLKNLPKWQKGQTGIPIVDAGMRELWQTGYMHNRVRMIVGSFLIKNLGLHWHHGEAWFWDCLVDADLASNSASWQWVAGSGADAAPYFRIFNPVTQAEKFDPEGTYIKKYVPELRDLDPPHLYAPWEAPAEKLKGANISLGDTYPHPLVDLKKSREWALAAYAEMREENEAAD